MIEGIIVLDDIFSKSYQDSIESMIMKNPDFPWYYSPSLSKPVDWALENDTDSPGWAHVFYHKNSGSSSSISNNLIPIAQEAFGKINLYMDSIIQGRVFQLLQRNNDLSENPPWHVDLSDVEHVVCLYYVNDSTGSTVISSKRFDPRLGPIVDNLEFPVEKAIEPKKGRVVMFDGNRYHRASNPQKG